MKKLLAVSLAFALFVPAFAGGILDNVTTKGEIQTIGSLVKHHPRIDGARDVDNRVIFGLDADLTEDVKATVSFLYTNNWDGRTGDSVQDYFDNILVAEANIALTNVFNAFEVKVGRQFYGDETSPVVYFGPNHYKKDMAPFSLDAAVVSYTSENFLFNVIYAKLVRTPRPTPPAKDLDTSLLGFDAKYNLNENLSLQAYLYTVTNKTNPSASEVYGFWGGKAAYQDDALNVSVEAAKNHWNDDSTRWFVYNDGWMVKADASFLLKLEAVDLTPRLGYAHSEKNFEANGNYAPSILSGSIGLFNGLLNNRILSAGLDAKFAALEKFAFTLNYFSAQLGTADNPEWLGNEFNLWVKYNLNDNVELHTGLAYSANTIYDKDPYAGQLGLIVKF